VSFFNVTRNGSITGVATRQHPFFVNGSTTTNFGMQALAGNVNSLTVFPLATTLERYDGKNDSSPANDIGLEFFEGGITTGDTGTIDKDDVPPYVGFDLAPITAEAPTVGGSAEIDAKAIEFRAVQAAASTALIQSAIRYVVDSNSALSWHTLGWTIALVSNAEEFFGLGMAGDLVTVESTRQSPWSRAGTFKQLMILAVMQSDDDDKTFTFALRVNGADVISVTADNDEKTGANVKLLTDASTEAAVAAGDFVNWRASMSGGYSANRAVQFMAMVGYEDDE
jgi:hypothetical protein